MTDDPVVILSAKRTPIGGFQASLKSVSATELGAVAIKACLELLPGEDSFLLTLYYFEELSLDEISKVTGLKPNNVKVKLFRSRKKLANVLKEQLDNETIESYGGSYRTAF